MHLRQMQKEKKKVLFIGVSFCTVLDTGQIKCMLLVQNAHKYKMLCLLKIVSVNSQTPDTV